MFAYEFSTTKSLSISPQLTSQARISEPVNRPSMRGRRNAPSMTPSNLPTPSIGMARVGAPNAVMIPARKRSLSCQLRLVTRNGIFDRSPYAVAPSNAM